MYTKYLLSESLYLRQAYPSRLEYVSEVADWDPPVISGLYVDSADFPGRRLKHAYVYEWKNRQSVSNDVTTGPVLKVELDTVYSSHAKYCSEPYTGRVKGRVDIWIRRDAMGLPELPERLIVRLD